MNNDLEPEQSGQMYEIEPSHYLTEEYPNLYVGPMMHNMDIHKTENVPMVVINFSTDDISLLKGEIMGFMQNQPLDISEIVTETSTEPSPILLEEDDKIEGLQDKRKQLFQKTKRRNLFTSPADIEMHWKNRTTGCQCL